METIWSHRVVAEVPWIDRDNRSLTGSDSEAGAPRIQPTVVVGQAAGCSFPSFWLCS
ncbi:MAG: hypothetical protein QOF30_3276 [Acidimicrobiaceae bacterium]|jgi:hypothetical protein|nr:hypothetical protein [Acidimicrobiaceae bacterium]